jgi:hypothetical protein
MAIRVIVVAFLLLEMVTGLYIENGWKISGSSFTVSNVSVGGLRRNMTVLPSTVDIATIVSGNLALTAFKPTLNHS